MLISHKYKFIFFKSLKTASTSTFTFFTPYCLPKNLAQTFDYDERPQKKHLGFYEEGIVGNKNAIKNIRHVKPKEVKIITDKINPSIWNDYFKFVNIRNPWDMVVSRYFFNKNYCNLKKNKTEENNAEEIEINTEEINDKEISFYKFVKKIYERFISGNEKVTRRDLYTLEEKYFCNFHIRYENIKEDIKEVCYNCNINNFEIEKLKNFNSEFRPKKNDYRLMYNETTKKLINEMYLIDIEKFKYNF